jgi:hypothetical protein
MRKMSEQEKKVIETFEKILPKLDETQRARLLGIGEGLSLAMEKKKEKIA